MPMLFTIDTKAFLKAQYWCQKATTEVAALGITKKDDPLHLEDLVLAEGEYTSANCDVSEADFAKCSLQALELAPIEQHTVWFHTHPGASADPSGLDETTYKGIFGLWPVSTMLILAKQGAWYCHTRWHTQSNVILRLANNVVIDWAPTEEFTFAPSELDADLTRCVRTKTYNYKKHNSSSSRISTYDPRTGSWSGIGDDSLGTELLGPDTIQELANNSLPLHTARKPVKAQRSRAAKPDWGDNHLTNLKNIHRALFGDGNTVGRPLNDVGADPRWTDWCNLIIRYNKAHPGTKFPVMFCYSELPIHAQAAIHDYIQHPEPKALPPSSLKLVN